MRVRDESASGYEGGCVFTSVTADCARGAEKQRSRTVFGNFHTVQVDCARGLVYDYDLDGVDCRSTPVGASGVDKRVCEACAMPFGIRDTEGVYATEPNATFAWERPTLADDGAVTYRGTDASLQLTVSFDAEGRLAAETVTQQGWQTTVLALSNFQAEIDAKLFRLPACFDDATEHRRRP